MLCSIDRGELGGTALNVVVVVVVDVCLARVLGIN